MGYSVKNVIKIVKKNQVYKCFNCYIMMVYIYIQQDLRHFKGQRLR